MFRWISILGLSGTLGAIVLHYLVFGPKRLPPAGSDGARATVRRFSIWERLVHFATASSFVLLAVSGFWPAIAAGDELHGWLWLVHAAAGAVFAVAMVFMTFSWAMDCRFAPYDWAWVRCFGGYLGGNKHAPAGRFNAGQKVFLWHVAAFGLITIVTGLGLMAPMFDDAVQAIVYEVHRYASLLFLTSILVHLYLGTFANPGTFRAMIWGTVRREWAELHHPLWRQTGGHSSESGTSEPRRQNAQRRGPGKFD